MHGWQYFAQLLPPCNLPLHTFLDTETTFPLAHAFRCAAGQTARCPTRAEEFRRRAMMMTVGGWESQDGGKRCASMSLNAFVW